MSGYKVFNVTLLQTFKIPFQIVKTNYDAFVVGIFLKIFINKPYSGIGHCDMFDFRVLTEEIS